jgi:hypothetical protein
MWIENRVLMCRPMHSWSERPALLYAETMKAKVATFEGAPWGSTVLLDQWELATPKVEEIIDELLLWCLQNNLKRLALVTAENPLQEFQLDNMLKSIAPDFERRYFSNEQLANQWMDAEGFPRKA